MKKYFLLIILFFQYIFSAQIEPGVALSWNNPSTHLAGAYVFKGFVDYWLDSDNGIGLSIDHYRTRTTIGYNNSPIEDDVLNINVTGVNLYYSRVFNNDFLPITAQCGAGVLSGLADMDTNNFLDYAANYGYTNSSLKTEVSFTPVIFVNAFVPLMTYQGVELRANAGVSRYKITPKITFTGDYGGSSTSISDETANEENILSWGLSAVFVLPSGGKKDSVAVAMSKETTPSVNLTEKTSTESSVATGSLQSIVEIQSTASAAAVTASPETVSGNTNAQSF